MCCMGYCMDPMELRKKFLHLIRLRMVACIYSEYMRTWGQSKKSFDKDIVIKIR